MEFKRDARVYAADDQVVGHVDRVVLNPNTKTVTHIVVRKGFLFGEDKVVPLSLIESANSERVALRAAAGDLDNLPLFEEAHYVPLTEDEMAAAAYAESLAEPLYWYPPVGGWLGHSYVPPYGMELEQNIPDHTIAVNQGARVITSDGREVGHVEQVFTDSNTNRATYFIIEHGFLSKTRKSIPTTWIREMGENEIHLSVGSGVIDELEEYLPA
ncbi:MAG: PRC-barrel domain-containing protein [Anaerolineae bacterium]|nr:PRC-barrel domain-containing protein [Anaerolineae bacterium]